MTQETQTPAWQKTATLSDIQAAAACIGAGFSWNETPEGYDYWEKVYDRLFDMTEALRAAKAKKAQNNDI